MFRRLPGSLPEDPKFPTDLNELGYFINEKSQIRKIDKPDETFHFHITNNDRYNEVHREAANAPIRVEVRSRMIELGIPPLYLPQLTMTKPKEPHVPIYATPPDILKTKRRILVVMNNGSSDLGFWSYRIVHGEGGITSGTCISLVQEIKRRADGNPDLEPGILILNPGELIYSHRENTAMTHTAWLGQPRPSAVHPANIIHPEHNLVPGNKTSAEHLAFVFGKILCNPDFVSKDAEFYLVGLMDGARYILEHLNHHRSNDLNNRVAAVALVQPTHSPSQLVSQPFQAFLADRARSYVLSSAPRGTCIAGPWHEAKPNEWGYIDTVSCATFASGECHFEELIFPHLYCEIVDWFAEVAGDVKCYVHPKIEVTDWDEQAGRPVVLEVETENGKVGAEIGHVVSGVDQELENATLGMQKVMLLSKRDGDMPADEVTEEITEAKPE